MPRSVTVECSGEQYEVVIRIPIKIDLASDEIVVRECDLPSFRMTQRERQILAMVCDGKQNKEIAAALNVSTRTVKFHVSSLLAKAGCQGRAELTKRYSARAL